jgi:catechol 2,3-dioxygenase-like lactoylglutathione lyase family enzyme
MPLHRLSRITMGVPDVAATSAYYADFGLTHLGDGRFTTVDGGEQLKIVQASRRRLEELVVGADTPDDIDRITAALRRLDVPVVRDAHRLRAVDPGTEVTVTVEVDPRIAQTAPAPVPYNAPGRAERPNVRAPGVLREGVVRPRRLGHVVLGSTDQEASQRFFTEGIGFKVSDLVRGSAAFMRCSTDHHNVLVQQAPLTFLHHSSWQVDDVDQVGRGATRMLQGHPERHVWGLGRHQVGSNFFWYLRDPAGNFSEYYSDMDCIVDDQLWSPGVWEGARALYNWGPPVPPSFLRPDDLAALMTGSHDAS